MSKRFKATFIQVFYLRPKGLQMRLSKQLSCVKYFFIMTEHLFIMTELFMIYKVVGHRPVCSCPSGTQNINGSCKSDTSCQWNDKRYDSGQHYYDSNCEQRCECLEGEFTCQPTNCADGLQPRGKLTNKVMLI